MEKKEEMLVEVEDEEEGDKRVKLLGRSGEERRLWSSEGLNTSLKKEEGKRRSGMTLIPPSQSPLLLQRTHHHTPPPLSACHPHGVTVMLALPLPSVCHVVSLLLCNFLLSFFSSSLFVVPGRNVSPVAPPLGVRGLNSPFWASDSVTESRRCLADSKNSRPLFSPSFLSFDIFPHGRVAT